MIVKMLKENNIDIIEHKKINKADILKISSKWNIVIIYSKDNTFTIKRNLFEYIDESNMNYSFCLVNKKDKKIYFLEFKNKNNWLKSSFLNCNKNELYFGKIVLQHRININDLIKKIQSYKN